MSDVSQFSVNRQRAIGTEGSFFGGLKQLSVAPSGPPATVLAYSRGLTTGYALWCHSSAVCDGLYD